MPCKRPSNRLPITRARVIPSHMPRTTPNNISRPNPDESITTAGESRTAKKISSTAPTSQVIKSNGSGNRTPPRSTKETSTPLHASAAVDRTCNHLLLAPKRSPRLRMSTALRHRRPHPPPRPVLNMRPSTQENPRSASILLYLCNLVKLTRLPPPRLTHKRTHIHRITRTRLPAWRATTPLTTEAILLPLYRPLQSTTLPLHLLPLRLLPAFLDVGPPALRNLPLAPHRIRLQLRPCHLLANNTCIHVKNAVKHASM